MATYQLVEELTTKIPTTEGKREGASVMLMRHLENPLMGQRLYPAAFRKSTLAMGSSLGCSFVHMTTPPLRKR